MCVFVVLQGDAISTLEKEHDYRDEHLDFIQSHVRRFCLQCILIMPLARNASITNLLLLLIV